MATYTVKYNANGGTNTPSSQTKTSGVTLYLTYTKPTKTGHNFDHWEAHYNDGTIGTLYPGSAYTKNTGATLYAMYTPKTYTVYFNANGGFGGPTEMTKTYGTIATIPSDTPSKTYYQFNGWMYEPTQGSYIAYKPGDLYGLDGSRTLYAAWSTTYRQPRINSAQINRCDASGDYTDSGSYMCLSLNFTSDYNLTNAFFEYATSAGAGGGEAWQTVDLLSYINGTSGTVANLVIPGVTFEPTYGYVVGIVLSDNNLEDGYFSRWRTSIAGSLYAIDTIVASDGSSVGVALCKPAEHSTIIDVGANMALRGELEFWKDGARVRGQYGNKGGTLYWDMEQQVYSSVMCFDDGAWFTDLRSAYHSDETVIYGRPHLALSVIDGTQFRPYYTAGDQIGFNSLNTAGYVTSSGNKVYATIPLSRTPLKIDGIRVMDNDGIKIRQNNAYFYGSGPYNYANAASMSAWFPGGNQITICFEFSSDTNPTNNSAVGIEWSGTLIFL